LWHLGWNINIFKIRGYVSGLISFTLVAYDAVSIGKWLLKMQRNFLSLYILSISFYACKGIMCVCRYVDITGTQGVRKAVWWVVGVYVEETEHRIRLIFRTFRTMKSRRKGCVKYVATFVRDEKRIHKFWSRNLERRDHLGYLLLHRKAV